VYRTSHTIIKWLQTGRIVNHKDTNTVYLIKYIVFVQDAVLSTVLANVFN